MEICLKKKMNKKTVKGKFPMAGVESRSDGVQGQWVTYCPTTTNVKQRRWIIIFITFAHEILPVDRGGGGGRYCQ